MRVHSFVTGVLGLSSFDALVRVFQWDNVSRDLDYENRLMGEFGAKGRTLVLNCSNLLLILPCHKSDQK